MNLRYFLTKTLEANKSQILYVSQDFIDDGVEPFVHPHIIFLNFESLLSVKAPKFVDSLNPKSKATLLRTIRSTTDHLLEDFAENVTVAVLSLMLQYKIIVIDNVGLTNKSCLAIENILKNFMDEKRCSTIIFLK